MSNSDKVILEERMLPERIRLLGGKRYVTRADGVVVKDSFICFCDSCGAQLLLEEKPVIICQVCRRKLCDSPSCAILYEGKHYCPDDLQRILPLRKLQFKVIHGLVNGLDINVVKELTRSRNEEFNASLNELRVGGYIERKGLSLFSYYELLEYAVLAWKTYYKAFSKDEDVAYFIEEVRNHIQESGKPAVKGNNGASR